jgi:hypothetical protein
VKIEAITPISASFLPDGRIAIFHTAPGEPGLLSIVAPQVGDRRPSPK